MADGLDIDVWDNEYVSAEPRFGEDFLEWPLTIEISAEEAPVAHGTVFDVVRHALPQMPLTRHYVVFLQQIARSGNREPLVKRLMRTWTVACANTAPRPGSG